MYRRPPSCAGVFDVGDKVPSGVGVKAGVRGGFAAAALIKQQHIIAGGVKEAAMIGVNAAARAAVQEHGRRGAGGADAFEMDLVAIADIQQARGIGFYRGVIVAQGHLSLMD
jgi:hypothetical protein